MAIVSLEEIQRTQQQLDEEFGIRSFIVQYAHWCIGSHYLKKCFGQKPGEYDDVKTNPRLLAIEENTDWDSLAIHAACLSGSGRRCLGRYHANEVRYREELFRLDDSQSSQPDYISLKAYVESLAGMEPGQFPHWGKPGLYPRRERPGEPVYLGEDCREKQHFDCVGLVGYVMRQVFGEKFDYGLTHYLNGSDNTHFDACRLEPPPRTLPQPGDLLVSDTHIAIVSGPDRIIHAAGERWGVRESGFDFGNSEYTKYKALCRLQRGYLRQRGRLNWTAA